MMDMEAGEADISLGESDSERSTDEAYDGGAESSQTSSEESGCPASPRPPVSDVPSNGELTSPDESDDPEQVSN